MRRKHEQIDARVCVGCASSMHELPLMLTVRWCDWNNRVSHREQDCAEQLLGSRWPTCSTSSFDLDHRHSLLVRLEIHSVYSDTSLVAGTNTHRTHEQHDRQHKLLVRLEIHSAISETSLVAGTNTHSMR